jgi:hypothetical protein
MDALDAVDLQIRNRLRAARLLRGAATFVDDGRARLTTKAVRLICELLVEMLECTPPAAGASPPPPTVSDQPPTG